MNKRVEVQQPFFRLKCFINPNQKVVDQEMSTVVTNLITDQSSYIQRGIQAILIK